MEEYDLELSPKRVIVTFNFGPQTEEGLWI